MSGDKFFDEAEVAIRQQRLNEAINRSYSEEMARRAAHRRRNPSRQFMWLTGPGKPAIFFGMGLLLIAWASDWSMPKTAGC